MYLLRKKHKTPSKVVKSGSVLHLSMSHVSSLYTQGSCAKDNFECGSYTIYGSNMCGFGALDV